jgi:hypothetical protein
LGDPEEQREEQNQEPSTQAKEPVENSDENSPEDAPSAPSTTETSEEAEEAHDISAAQDTVTQNAQTILVTSQPGDSLTTLARRATSQFISSRNEGLSPEQKIYMEDYLVKYSGNTPAVGVNQEVGFSVSVLENA